MAARVAIEGKSQIGAVRRSGGLIGGEFVLRREGKMTVKIAQETDFGRGVGSLELRGIEGVVRDKAPEQYAQLLELSLGDDLTAWMRLWRHVGDSCVSGARRRMLTTATGYLNWAVAVAVAVGAAIGLAFAGGVGAGLKNVTRHPPAAAIKMPR